MSFKKDLTKGVAYTAIAKYLNILVSLVVTAILARLLYPEDFGIIAIATVFIGLITLLTGSGLSPAIIQRQNLNKSEIESLFSFTLYLSLIATLIFYFSIPVISKFYNSRILENICYLLLINVFFSVINIVPNALLFKDKKFKYIAIRTIVVQSSLGILSVIGAYFGLGVYALLVNPIIGSILLFAVSYRCYKIKLRLQFDLLVVREVLPYSIFQVGFNILNFTYRNVDKILIGRYFGMNELGFYEKSYRLMMLPLENFSNVINPVLHPLLSEYQNTPTFIFDKYKKLTRYFGYVGFILTSFCFVNANNIVLILFGEKWIPSISIFRILSLSIGLQVIQSAVGAVFQATGNVKLLFYSGFFSFIITCSAIIVGIICKNIIYLATFLVIAFFISFFIYHYVLVHNVMRESLWSFLSSLIKPLICGLIMGAVLFFTKVINLTSNIYIEFALSIFITILSVLILQRLKLITGFPDIYSLLIKGFKNVKVHR